MNDARDVLETLFDHIYPIARKEAEEEGTVVPFAVTLDGEGTTRFLRAAEDTLEQIYNTVVAGLTQDASAGKLAAFVLTYPAQVLDQDTGEARNAIFFQMEHQSKQALKFAFPYEAVADGTRVADEPIIMNVPAEIF